jgi:hypothetical protein
MTSFPRFRRALPFLATLLTASSGCSYHLFSPPAHIGNVESAAPAKPGETIVGAHGGPYGAIFEGGAAVMGGAVRRGVRKNLELNGEATYAHVEIDDSPSVDRNVFIGRTGAKFGTEYIAAVGGVGGGYSLAAGGFMAADVGFIASFHNCYVVPFISPSVFVSTPVGAKTVTFDNGQTSRTSTSLGEMLAGGIEIQLSPSRCHEGRTSPRLQLGLNTFNISTAGESTTDPQTGETYMTVDNTHAGAGIAVGLEFPLSL